MQMLRHIGKIAVIGLMLSSLLSCGFQLRGQFCIPTAFQRLKICPDERFNPFQRILRRNFKSNGICVIDFKQTESVCSLSIINQAFSERDIVYGSDAQINRVLLQFEVTYQILDPNCQTFSAENTIRVERELVINPNAVLGTETERSQVEEDLYQDAATQLIRQLSAIPTS